MCNLFMTVSPQIQSVCLGMKEYLLEERIFIIHEYSKKTHY